MKKTVEMRSVNGAKWIATLPKGYDDANVKLVTTPGGGLIVLHPSKPPLRVLDTGKTEEIQVT